MQKFNKTPEHIYIHWPFCKNKCHYCDFISFQNHEGFEQQYHNTLCKEIQNFSQNLKNQNQKSIKTIFLGGGTPSLYPKKLLKELFEILNKIFDLTKLQEVTIETNPTDITKEKLATWQSLGINRLSIGVQILNNKILENLNRIQTQKEVLNAIKIASKYFDNISIDLNLGLQRTTNQIWKQKLKTITNRPIKHISVYLLTVYEKTPLFFKVEQKQLEIFKDAQFINLYKNTVEFFQQKGFEQYEISNFAKPNFESIHNKAYWDRKPYKGFGLSASSFNGSCRYINEKNLSKYLSYQNKQNRQKAFYFEEKLDKKQEILETLMLKLRQRKGVNLHYMLYFLKDVEQKKFLNEVKAFKAENLIQEAGGNINLTLKGMLLENEIILRLI